MMKVLGVATATDRMMVATTKTLINTMSPLEGVSQKIPSPFSLITVSWPNTVLIRVQTRYVITDKSNSGNLTTDGDTDKINYSSEIGELKITQSIIINYCDLA